jgi:hypothetical protein
MLKETSPTVIASRPKSRAQERSSRLGRERQRNTDTRTERSQDLFQIIYDASVARDVTIHFNLEVFQDFDAETENFSRLWRLGNFTAARSFFEQNLMGHLSHLSHPVVFIQYAEVLLDMGDYKAFKLLKPPRSVKEWQVLADVQDLYMRMKPKSWKPQYWFTPDDHIVPMIHGGRPRSGRPRPSQSFPPKIGRMREERLSYDETSFLHMIRSLLKAGFEGRHNNAIDKALDEAAFVLDALVISSDFSSTEVGPLLKCGF